MIKYSDEDIKHARKYNVRFAILYLKNSMNYFKIQNIQKNGYSGYDGEYRILEKEFDKMLILYDKDEIKLNEEYLLNLKYKKLNPNILVLKRMIKLIKLV